MSALTCDLYIITGTFKCWEPKIRTPSCTLCCRCTCASQAVVSAAQFSSVGMIQKLPKAVKFQRTGGVATVSVAFCILAEREEKGDRRIGAIVSSQPCKRMAVWICRLGVHRAALLPAACGKPFLLEGVGFWKCSVAEPMENRSRERQVLLHPLRFHWARFCHAFGKAK